MPSCGVGGGEWEFSWFQGLLGFPFFGVMGVGFLRVLGWLGLGFKSHHLNLEERRFMMGLGYHGVSGLQGCSVAGFLSVLLLLLCEQKVAVFEPMYSVPSLLPVAAMLLGMFHVWIRVGRDVHISTAERVSEKERGRGMGL